MENIRCKITGIIFIFCILASALFAQPAETIAIKCGKLIDGKSDRALDNQIILIQNNRITAESVRAASFEVLRSRREKSRNTHPFYWAAFVAAGDWR